MKTINIFGKRMSILAILMAALIVGTASAAVISHYGTLNSSVSVPSAITVNGMDINTGTTIEFNNNLVVYPDTTELTFTVGNAGSSAIDVLLLTTITVDSTSYCGLVTYSADNGGIIDGEKFTVNPGTTVVTATFAPQQDIVGTHDITITLSPYWASP